MDHRAVRAGAADRLEADFLQRIGGAAAGFELLDHVDFRQPALRRLGIEPGEEFHHCRAVPEMGLPHPLNLARVLARLGQEAGIGVAGDGDACRFQFADDRQRRGRGIDPDRSAQGAQGGNEGGGRAGGDIGAKMVADVAGQLLRRDEKRHMGVVLQDREGLHDRVALDIRAADVEQPRYRLGQREDRRRLSGRLQFRGEAGAFVGGAFAREFQRLRADRAKRRGRAIGPDGIDEILGRAERDAGAFEPALDLRDLLGGVQPGIEGDAPALGHLGPEPVGGLRLGPVHRGEGSGIDLRPDLGPVTAVDEDAGDPRQRDAEAGRAGEPGEPGQPLVGGGDVFALMPVRARDDEAVEPGPCQFLPQRGQPGRPLFGAGGRLETLEHAGALALAGRDALGRMTRPV